MRAKVLAASVLLLAGAAGAGSLARAADAKAGEAIYERCAACHAIGHDRAGPRHCGVVGRRAGSVKGFEYSAAMRDSKIVWTEASLDRFLANPMKAVPGTSMGYAGISSASERADLVAYLKLAGDPRRCGGPPQAPEK